MRLKLCALLLSTPVLLPVLGLVSAPALACSETSSIMWTQPVPSTGELPADGVLRMLIGEGDSVRSDFSLSLDKINGEAVAGDVQIEAHPGNSPFEDRYLHTFVPDEALEVGGRYVMRIAHVSGDEDLERNIAFDAVEPLGSSISEQPAVEVLSAYETDGEGDTGCDFDRVRVFEVAVTPAQGDPDELSVVHLYRVEDASDDDWSYARTVRVTESGSTESQELRTDQLNQSGRCFVAVQEDISGAQSPASSVECAPEPLTADEGSGDSGASARPQSGDSGSACRGCAAGGGAAGFVALMLGTVLAAGRRR